MSVMTKLTVLVGIVASIVGAGYMLAPPDLLKSLSSDVVLNKWQLQLSVTGFCLSPVPSMLLQPDRSQNIGGEWEFKEDGDIENEDYSKASIYSLLYAMYSNMGTVVSDKGVPYEFTFNTWGIAPSPYGEEDPQRHGKAAYAGLVNFPTVKRYLEEVTDSPSIVEIGCGTGAGANLITREILPTASYLAIDMQRAAINTCRKMHATADNPNLHCVHAPGGVGNDGNKVLDMNGTVVPDNSVDFVIISETHIADIEIGQEEKDIFAEIHRILKPGGLFLWGNALPTRVWTAAFPYLSENGFDRVESLNHTQGAITARDEDVPRVNAYCDQLFGQYAVFKAPVVGEKCLIVVDRLLKNFYRHPGTALYLKMVSGYDSYMHECYQKQA